MTGKVRTYRIFFLLLVFVLAFSPINILAETNTSKDIQYVSLGDSLAASVLADSTIGTGYVGNIEKALETTGYQVTVTNKGVSGYTSADVLNELTQITELKDANIVTISAGANDLLDEIDINKVKELQQKNLDIAKLITLEATFNQKLQTLFINGTNFFSEVDKLIANTDKYIGMIGNFLDPKVIEDYNNLKNDIVNAKNSFSQANTAFKANNNTYQLLLLTAYNQLNSAQNKFDNFKDNHPSLATAFNDISILFTELDTFKNEVNELITLYTKESNNIKIVQDIKQMLDNAKNKIPTVAENIDKIISYIKQQNPNANIYVMGYYNALPYLDAGVQGFTVPIIQGLNNAIETTVKAVNATFIPTYSLFEGNYSTYLPNQLDIHPSEEGYRAIANAFMEEIIKVYPPIKIDMNLGEKVSVQKGQVITIKDTNVTLILPDDLPNGTNLTVTKTDDEKLKDLKDIKTVGDVLNFNLEIPSNSQYNGTFKLIMKYEDSSDNVDIYYYDEQTNEWIKQNGELNKETKEVSLDVSHFSNYGVFAKVNSSTTIDNQKNGNIDCNEKSNGNNNSTVSKHQANDVKETNKTTQITSNQLPKTSTHYYNWILIGCILIGAGSIILRLYNIWCW